MERRIKNKKTGEEFIILGFAGDAANAYCIIANKKTGEMDYVTLYSLRKKYVCLN